MKTKEILEVYRRYVKSLRDRNADLVANYRAMDRVLTKHCEDKRLKGLLDIDLKFVTLTTIKSKGIILRDLAGGNWNSYAVKECYSRIKKLQEAWDDDFDTNRFTALFTRLSTCFPPTEPEIYGTAIWTIPDLVRFSFTDSSSAIAGNAIKTKAVTIDNKTVILFAVNILTPSH